MKRYAVIYNNNEGAVGVINIFKTRKEAERQVKEARKSPSFKKLGFSKPRIKVEKEF